ncbi:hypothetical protein HK405_001199, partial [Cladochytrium tenue]
YITTACATLRIFSRVFGPLVAETLLRSARISSPGIDFAREEREQRCAACHQRFRDVALTLAELRRAPGRVGAAVKDTLAELGGWLGELEASGAAAPGGAGRGVGV